jgi:hypothetical protein
MLSFRRAHHSWGSPQKLYSPYLKEILVTDVTGQQSLVKDPRFETSNEFEKDYLHGYFEFTVSLEPRRDVWVHASCVKQVSFTKGKEASDLRVNVTLH